MQQYRKRGIYEKYIKRFFDILFSILIMILFFWLYALLAIIIRIKLGKSVIFTQLRPGMIDSKTGKERIFKLYKFRSMSNERDAAGNYLPDEARLGKFGKALRASSLDELPEVFNILKGDMSFVGPRPFLVRDMVFMTDEERLRHTARPGLTGLAQVMGRNAITWEEKFEWDIKYIKRISFISDAGIFFLTVKKVLVSVIGRPDTTETDVTDDYGDYLLKKNAITQSDYYDKQQEAKTILDRITQED